MRYRKVRTALHWISTFVNVMLHCCAPAYAVSRQLTSTSFHLIDAKDPNESLNVAAQILPAKYGSIEVRPVRELDVAGYRSFSPGGATGSL
jgi:hypothetical protein